jgi:MscS family membrane protein
VDDPLGRSTPYGCVFGFLAAVNAGNLPKAVQYLDTKLPEAKAEELAVQLKAVLDSGLSSTLNGLSRDPIGDLKDELRITRERVGVVQTPSGKVDILLDRVSRPDEPNIWLFSSETLAKIPNLHANIKRRDFSQYFSAPIFQVKFLTLPLWRWLTMSVGILFIIAFSTLVTRLLLWLAKLILRKRHLENESAILTRLKQPVRILLLALAISLLKPYTVSILARSYWTATSRLLAGLGFAWLLIRLADVVAAAAARRSLALGARQKLAVITLAQRLFKILAVLVLFLLLLKGAGINVSAMLAGLGIGGVALALAAQKTLEDLFGGISIIMRDSIRVGDYCQVADQTGVIQDIGLSSTRIRTLNRTVVSIPNSKIASLNSENYALRDKFWFHHILSLSADATNPQLEEIATKVTDLLDHSNEVEMTSSRIKLIGLSHASPQFEIFAYVLTSTYELFLVEQQRLLLKILAIISDAGTRLSSPSQITHIELENSEAIPAPPPPPKVSP